MNATYARNASATAILSFFWTLPIIGWFILVALGMVVTAYQAHVLTDIWRWFAVPNGFQPLTFAKAVGLLVVVTFLKYNPVSVTKYDVDSSKSTATKAIEALLLTTVWTTFSWGGAYVWHWYLG